MAMVREQRDDAAVMKAQRDVEEFMKPWKLVFRDLKKALTATDKRGRYIESSYG